jgi:hypothetical protein
MRRPFILALAIGTAALGAMPASAMTWDGCIKKLCKSTSQNDCWVKAWAALCDRDQTSCRDLPDHAPAKVIKRVGHRWQVQTSYGNGWVSDRMMMVDGSKCNISP